MKAELLNVQINLTNRCQWHCDFCKKYTWPQIELDYFLLEKVLADLDPDTTTVVLSGGEPSVYRHINKTLRLLNKNYFKWGIFTNGTGWEEESFGALTGAKWIRMSVLSDDRKILNTLVQQDSLIEQRAFVQTMKNRGANITGECVCVAENKLSLPTTDFWQIPISYYNAHDYNGDAQLSLVGDRYERYIIPYFHCLIDPSGDVYPDCVVYGDNINYNSGEALRRSFCEGNLNNLSIIDIFYSKTADSIRARLLWLFNNRPELRKRTERYAQKNRILYEFLNKRIFL